MGYEEVVLTASSRGGSKSARDCKADQGAKSAKALGFGSYALMFLCNCDVTFQQQEVALLCKMPGWQVALLQAAAVFVCFLGVAGHCLQGHVRC
jgi:hypothetical protein